MRKIVVLLSLLFTTLAIGVLPVDEAEAKRFGFGKSIGKQTTLSRQQSSGQRTTTRSTQQDAAGSGTVGSRATGASRWLGPLAGLAAGGLLASLLFGDGFEGLQMMDLLVFGLLIFGAMALLRNLRQRAAPQWAGVGGLGGGPVQQPRLAPEAAPAGARMETPDWFDGERFAAGAKTHFIRLQAAWDGNDMRDIAEYTTPELYAALQTERLERGDERHFTEVVTLNAELVETRREGDKVVASVRIEGLIREEREGAAQAFSEVWHVVHDWDTPDGDWRVAGIQQV
ncbi:MAG: Tim44 domain-containing protein [gamma proteobacterium symbiont of Phacoides pectinatus]